MLILEMKELKPVFIKYELLSNDIVSYDTKETILELCKELREEIQNNKDNIFVLDAKELSNIYYLEILKEKIDNKTGLFKITKERLLENIKEVEYRYSLLDIDKDITKELLEDTIEVRFKIGDTIITIGSQLSMGLCNTITIAKNLKDELSISIGYTEYHMPDMDTFTFTIPENKKVKFKLISNNNDISILEEKYIEVTIE